ncbi:SSI family serine proteinase inhibitor [Actinoplanes sp. NPDC049802]|uniref:SSI family serine proteinase inhibitor n=1 Tax=Actinoplanes sp. NPDC049802 TaxID=3154742 RepID=UPI0033C0591E
MIRTMIGLAAVCAVGAGAASPASAVVPSELTLTYQAKAVDLTCDPAGGDHPHARQACTVLRGIGGDPKRLKSGDSFCFLLYAPVTARLKGTWRGRSVTWERTYGNSCEMARATGVLFRF